MKILLVGCTGQMGRQLTETFKEEADLEIVAGIALEKDDSLGYPVYLDFEEVKEEPEMVVDYSSAKNTKALLKYVTSHKIPVIIAATGQTEEEEKAIREASEITPILKSGNMSLGINLLMKLVEEAAETLQGYDVEIVEAHHNKKVDAPSGTARMLADAVDAGRRGVAERVYGRYGREAQREKDEVGVHSLRGGTIVGEHAVIFAGTDEIVTLKHSAHSKKIFSNGTVRAIRFMRDVPVGFYTMKDIFK